MKTLERKALKNLMGGSEMGTVDSISEASGTCGVVGTFNNGTRCLIDYDINKSTAINYMNTVNSGQTDWGVDGGLDHANWCCASCSNFSKC